MRKILILFLSIYCVSVSAQSEMQPIGQWREHLPYNSTIDIAAGGGKVFAATPFSIFSVNEDGEKERYSRITGLNETGISAIAYDAANEKLFIAYTNSNIDIIYRNDIYNIPDIKRDNIIGNKTIYSIYPLQHLFYLSTGLGVIVIDGNRYEVKDSWFIGNGGNPVRVNGFTSDGSFFYAATEEGLKRAAVNALHLADAGNWQLLSGTNGLSIGACQNVFSIASRVYLQKSDSLFVQNGGSWSLCYTGGWPMINTTATENKISICERQINGVARLVFLNPDGTIDRVVANTAAVSLPRKSIFVNGTPWVADQYAGLSKITSSGHESYTINAPQNISSGEMVVHQNTLYVTAGAVNDNWNYQYNGEGIYVFKDGSWTNINRYHYTAIDSLLDFLCVAIDKRDETIWAGSYGGGLLHIKPGPLFEIFKQNTLDAAVGDPGSYRVAGLAFDADNNLWVSNFGAAQPLRVRKADGSWKSISIPFSLFSNAVSQLVIDNNNYKWIVSPLGNGLICYDAGASIDNISDDSWRLYGAGSGNGNLPSSNVLSVAMDKSGFIWVGTADGIGVIQCTENVFNGGGCSAVWPVVANGNFAGYLFKGQEVRSIAVDGADRKWVATKNGVFLVSADGEKMIYHFTEENSPLLSNDVKKIALDGKTGEVYFATQKGLCSFRSTATEGGDKNDEVLVFPNPVPPGYSGSIAIRGLVNNAIVKITELDGRLVYQTRALGGQAVWNGKNYRGQTISSGVYLVLISDETGKEKMATKVFFVGH